MPDYGVFVTFEKDPHGWGPEFPMGRLACTFQRACQEWSTGLHMLREEAACGRPKEIHMLRYRYDGGPIAVVRLSFRDVRSAARGVVDEETLFKTQGVDPDAFMSRLVANERLRRARRPRAS